MHAHGLRKGSVCVYWPVTKRWGVKLFKKREDRDHSYSFCSWAAGYGLAPQVRLPFSARGEFGYAIEVCDRPTGITKKQLWKLYTDLRLLGIDNPNDVNLRNTGTLRGKVVLFDLSKCSCDFHLKSYDALLLLRKSMSSTGDTPVPSAAR
jgi:hypothetical protein